MGRRSWRLGCARLVGRRTGAGQPKAHSGRGSRERELDPTTLSRPTSRGRCDDDTSAPQSGEDEDNPNMLL
jgi:hypothetical protein